LPQPSRPVYALCPPRLLRPIEPRLAARLDATVAKYKGSTSEKETGSELYLHYAPRAIGSVPSRSSSSSSSEVDRPCTFE
jgi:hypothetical protein